MLQDIRSIWGAETWLELVQYHFNALKWGTDSSLDDTEVLQQWEAKQAPKVAATNILAARHSKIETPQPTDAEYTAKVKAQQEQSTPQAKKNQLLKKLKVKKK